MEDVERENGKAKIPLGCKDFFMIRTLGCYCLNAVNRVDMFSKYIQAYSIMNNIKKTTVK
jgi:hypothetical protein